GFGTVLDTPTSRRRVSLTSTTTLSFSATASRPIPGIRSAPGCDASASTMAGFLLPTAAPSRTVNPAPLHTHCLTAPVWWGIGIGTIRGSTRRPSSLVETHEHGFVDSGGLL